MSAFVAPRTPESPLELPVTGQALRMALAARDASGLMDCAHQLRVAGYRVDPARLANELLANGCTWVQDAFGHPVALQVQVPRAVARQQPDEACSFRIAA
ncbi:hypothetical protein [Ideonella sp.]|uniref:hypothetical protein n=1 Tax=Ideonella sp. TaxID=1929293 RepID=UPI003BB5485A